MVKLKNVSSYWLDENTFCINFDGRIDDDGDEYFYLCEYWLDKDEYKFIKMYEYDNVKADFTVEEKEYIQTQMCKYMKQ